MEEKGIVSFFERHAVSFKVVLIAILILLLLIPIVMVQSLIHERKARQAGVISEIASKWGQTQTIIGPLISIPYIDYFEDEAGNRRETMKAIYVLPETLEVSAKILPTIRYRGIYKAVLYESEIHLKGQFSLSALSAFSFQRY